jgi:hypothetical protein
MTVQKDVLKVSKFNGKQATFPAANRIPKERSSNTSDLKKVIAPSPIALISTYSNFKK